MRSRKRYLQLTLDQARKPDGKHGGWRPHSGRKRKPGAISHSVRARLAPSHPVHVTIRIADGVASIARDWLMNKVIRKVIAASHKPWFRIVEFNVLTNHVHLLVEADGTGQLSRGVQGFEVRLARRLNAAWKRSGKLFSHRFHARALRTPREVRNAIRYVLQNRKHHGAEKKFDKYWIDPYSSAAWFDGWAEPIRADTDWKRELVRAPRPTEKATVWLLTTGWKRHGWLRFEERPA